jgi:bleomycin hydrolase
MNRFACLNDIMSSIHPFLSVILLAAVLIHPTVSCGQDDLQKASEVSQSEIEKSRQRKTDKVNYEFTVQHSIDHTPVKSQDSTGTCWCFAATSFFEAELLRKGKGDHDLSEMFIVYNIYREKARNFVLRQGKANFSEGALAHDFINGASRYGFVPEEIFSGKEPESRHNHGEMVALLEAMLKGVVDRPKLTPKWEIAFDRVLQTYLGEVPERFTYRGQSYSPKEFAESLDFRKDDYLNLTSFSHHPFYENFVLEIPDNFSNGSFFNVPIDDLIETIDHAIENGFTVCWDADVSERGFSQGFGLAIMPQEADRKDLFQVVGEELSVNQAMRQETLMSKDTTDDHLMHITGIAKDPLGNKYYLVKNSWGEMGPYQGYLYASEAYVRLKTIGILLHRDGAPAKLRNAR